MLDLSEVHFKSYNHQWQNWRTQKIAVFDIETTGFLEPDEDGENRITQFCCHVYNGVSSEDPIESLNILVNPERPIPVEASKVTGITDELVADEPQLDDVWDDMYDILYNADIIVGHNITGFDIPFLYKELAPRIERTNHEWILRPYIDTFAWSFHQNKHRLSNTNLKASAAKYGCGIVGDVEHGNIALHDAENDVKTNYQLLEVYSRKVITYSAMTELLEEQGKLLGKIDKLRSKKKKRKGKR